MQSEPLARENESVNPAGLARLLWNGEPFRIVGAVRRKSKIVRTKLVPAEMRRRYNQAGWPRDLVIMREHSVKLRGEDITLKVVTNADEAEDEIPDSIDTPIRDMGTYRDALVVWRGRPVRSFVSARVASPTASESPAVEAPPASTADPAIEHMLAAALRVLKSGLLVTRAELPTKMTDDEKVLANFLLSTRDDSSRSPLSLAEIGRVLSCSDEAVRRRQRKLEEKFPVLAPVFRSFRSRNHKGDPVPPLQPHRDDHDDAA